KYDACQNDCHRSNLNANDLANHEISNRLQTDCGCDECVANGIGEQGLEEFRFHHQHGHDNYRRHRHQQHHGQTALRGVNADLPQNFEALTNHVREVVQKFGKIAASLALQHDCCHEKFNVHQRHTRGQIDKRV